MNSNRQTLVSRRAQRITEHDSLNKKAQPLGWANHLVTGLTSGDHRVRSDRSGLSTRFAYKSPIDPVVKPLARHSYCAFDFWAVLGRDATLPAPFLNDPIAGYFEHARHLGQRLESADGFVERSVLGTFSERVHGLDSILVKLAIPDDSLENPAMTLEKLADSIRA